MVACVPAADAAGTVVPLAAQVRILVVAGPQAVVPTRMAFGYRYRTWSYGSRARRLAIRFDDRRRPPGARSLAFVAEPFRRPLARCGDGRQKTMQLAGNKVYWDGREAWRCIAGPRGAVRVAASGPALPDVALGRVVASARRLP